MEAIPSQHRVLLATATFVVGVAVSSANHTPLGLLAPTAALFLFATRRIGLALLVASAAGLLGSLVVAALYDAGSRDFAAAWAAFFALALCMGALVATHSARNAETTPAGKQTPPFPVIGPTLQEKAVPRHAPFVCVSAQDHKTSAALMAISSFWGGIQFHIRYWRRLADGTYRWTEVRTEPLREPSGTQQWRGVAADIDDERPDENPPSRMASHPRSDDDAVRAAKIVENLLGNAWAFDVAGRPTYLTPMAQTFVAVTLEEFQAAVDAGETFFKCTAHPDDYERISAVWRRSLQTGEPFFVDRRIRRASGIHEWNRTGFVPTRGGDGRITGWYGSTIDLDSHRIAQAELRERERELSQLVDLVPSHIWRLNRDGEPVFFNRRMVDFLGLDVTDLDKPGNTRLELMTEVIHADDAHEFTSELRRCLASGESFNMRYRMRRADGVHCWMSSRAEPMRDHEGRIIQWYGLCQDIEDQMRAEEALRQSERQLQQLIDTVPAAIWCTTAEGVPSYLNKWATDVTGATVEDLLAPDGSRNVTIIHPEDRDAIDQAMARAFQTGKPFLERYRQRRANGPHRWVESRAEPLRDDAGKIVRWYGVSTDIHDMVTAQDALRDRERELSQLVNMVPVHIRRLTPQGEPTFFNKRLMDFFGLGDLAEMDKPGMSRLAATINSLVHPDDTDRLLSTARASFDSGEPFSIKYRMRSAEGVYRWVDTRGEPLRDQNGSIIQWYVISLDIDDEMGARQALEERERELRQLVDVVPVAIARLAPDGNPTFFNKGLIDYLGLNYADFEKPGVSLRAAVLAAAVHPDDLVGVTEAFEHSLATGEPFRRNYRMLHASGVYRWIENRIEPLRDQKGTAVQWYGVCVDIDDQMRLFNEVEEREGKIRRLVDSDVIGVVFWDLDGTLLDANDAFLRMVQYDRAELQAGLDWFAMTPPEWQEVHAREEAAELAATGKMQAREKEYFRKDGSRVPILIGAACFEGQPNRGVAYILDLTEQKRVEAALRVRERELQDIIDAVPVRIWRAAPNDELVYFNKRYQDHFRSVIPNFDAVDRPGIGDLLQQLVHPDEAPGVERTLGRCFGSGDSAVMRFRWREKEDAYRWAECRVEPRRDADGAIVQWYGASIDIDDEVRAQAELRRTQERLAQASQAASLAELSASIAHEVNQPLAAVVANSHACKRWLNADPPNLERVHTTVERIIRDANGAADVVGRIRALFKQDLVARGDSSIAQVIGDAHRWVSDLAMRHGVFVDVRVDPNVPPVVIDQVQIQQVLNNLMRNAVEAMATTPAPRMLGVRAVTDSDGVRIEVRDSGGGIEDAEKIFDAFFTTKGTGMGMGLAISRSIVESHGGRLWAEQNKDRGATFILTLPVDSPAQA